MSQFQSPVATQIQSNQIHPRSSPEFNLLQELRLCPDQGGP